MEFESRKERQVTRVFVLTNNKGGVGKSTSATNIALGMVGMFRRMGAPNSRVLLIDTDSQAHATLVTTGRNDYGVNDSLYAVLTAERGNAPQLLLDLVQPSAWDTDLHVLPASPLLEAAERELFGTAGAPYRLADPLNQVRGEYGAIVIDTRPSFSLLTEAALISSTDAIIPVEPRYLETVGLMSVIGKINDIRDGWRHPTLHVSGILVTKMDARIRGHQHLLDQLKEHPTLGKLVLGVIPANEAVSYAHVNHQSIFAYAPQSAASKAYAQLVSTLVRAMVQEPA